MLKLVCALMMWHLVTTEEEMEVYNTFGIRMCDELCAGSGHCQSILCPRRELHCHFSGINNTSGRHLHGEKKRYFYRTITFSSKKVAFISNEKLSRSVNPKPRMPHGYIRLKIGGKTFMAKRHEQKLPWSAARNVCRSEGGDLMKVDTKAKNAAVKRRLSRNNDISENFCMWIGLTDPDKSNSYRWIDGSPVVYTNWFNSITKTKGKSNEGSDESCVCMQTMLFLGFHWRDSACHESNGFICARD